MWNQARTSTYLDVFHQFLRTVLTVQHSQVREDARVSIVQTETLRGVREREIEGVCEGVYVYVQQ